MTLATLLRCGAWAVQQIGVSPVAADEVRRRWKLEAEGQVEYVAELYDGFGRATRILVCSRCVAKYSCVHTRTIREAIRQGQISPE